MSPDDERYIGYLISDVARLMRTVFDRRMRELGLTRSQWLALTRLHRRPGLSQSEVADLLEIEKASAGRLIDRLEENGWVERRPDPKDRRINRVYLSARAERVHASIWPIAEATVDEALGDLSSAERRRFTSMMVRVKNTLQTMAETTSPAEDGDPAAVEREVRAS
jgi:DNA-binding MarR family transcriptional regulator